MERVGEPVHDTGLRFRGQRVVASHLAIVAIPLLLPKGITGIIQRLQSHNLVHPCEPPTDAGHRGMVQTFQLLIIPDINVWGMVQEDGVMDISREKNGVVMDIRRLILVLDELFCITVGI
ncbi:MAG TPA: hypothetical protein ENH10_00455 [Bacteroidetes bacterium]|nr:hypothetical protein BMS3Bbin04_00808 [bacterium BMS3Bbin04]HDO64491.1 hypothetical protein [Bacteroidota bacterium]HEX03616.1 hypothetical protein [Bacteroidota bacterium]